MPTAGSGSLESLRERNRRPLVDALRDQGSASRADLARTTGPVALDRLDAVADLQASGLVIEHGLRARWRASAAGPPADAPDARPLRRPRARDRLRPRPRPRRDRRPSRTILAERMLDHDVDTSASRALDVAIELADVVVAEADVDGDRILGAGVGLSGPIDVAAGGVHAGKILPGWAGVRPADELAARLGMHVHLDNDANLGALAEVTLGAGVGARDAIYLDGLRRNRRRPDPRR